MTQETNPGLLANCRIFRSKAAGIRWQRAAICIAMAITCGSARGAAAEPNDGVNRASLATLLRQQTRITFDAVAQYVKQNPQADDIDQAYSWLFQTARLSGLEEAALPMAEKYLNRTQTDEATAGRARRIQILGMAVTGKMDEAIHGFERELRGVRLRSPNPTIDFALELASRAQLADNFAASRSIIERLSSAFFLNPYVSTLCENRLVRLELANQQAPKISVDDFQGKSVDIVGFQGKVLLIDFWATNCGPCLEEFPVMKQLYSEYHAKGLEIIGISLDEDREVVEAFQQKWKLPWRMALSSADGGATRKRYRARTVPTSYLVDRKGRIVRIDVRGHNLRRSLEQLLGTDD
jgi:thiol-disulfide isomerase/thioredoxin